MFFIYSLLYSIAIIILFLPQYLKRPGELRRRWLREKFGSFGSLKKDDSRSIWVHAVSVGEVGASIPLLKKLRSRYPEYRIILSTITDTGQKVALEKSPEGTRVIYLPFDMMFILRRAFRTLGPKIFITIETEIWPNIFKTLVEEGVPVLVLNGRISQKSLLGYKKISFFMKRVFQDVKMFGMQSSVDAERLEQIGADKEKIVVLGNFKFDINTPGEIPSWARNLKGPIIVAGSTHKGEEEIMLSAYYENLAAFPGLKLILAPRHPERFQEVEDILRSKGAPFVKRSELAGRAPEDISEGVILLDGIGELSSVYGIADIAVIGKSFTGQGGQNPLEPACLGKTVLCGPHMENFPFIDDFYAEGAAFEVEASEIGRKIEELLEAPEKIKAAGEKAKELYMRNSGAVEKALRIIGEYI